MLCGRLLSELAGSSVCARLCVRAVHYNQPYTVVDHPWIINNEKLDKYNTTPSKWKYYNRVIWPPNFINPATDEPKVAEVFHVRENIKYSPKKMWTVCQLIRGLSIDEACKQLHFVQRKGAKIALEVLREAQEKAVNDNLIEYKSNLWVAEAVAQQGMVVNGMRRHAKFKIGRVSYRYVHLFIRLEEGKPPPYSTRDDPNPTGWTKMKEHVDYLRDRRIKYPV